MNRRSVMARAAAFGTALALPSLGRAAEQTRIVVGFPPGGGTDVIARILAAELSPLWGTTINVVNTAGAAGTIAARYVAGQPADGRTLLLAHINSHGIAPGLFPKLGYAADKDFTPITMIGKTPMLLVCTPEQPVRTLKGIVELCRQKPGRVAFGSAGNGSAQHLALEEFKARAGIDALHVPYKGSAPLLTDLLGGQVQYAFEGMTSATPHIKAGRLVAVAQTRATRSPTFAQVPTIAEQGYPGFDASIWFALVAPAGLPSAQVRRMNEDLNKVLATPAIAAKLRESGAEDGGGTPDKLDAFMKAEQARWARVIKAARITPD